LKVRGFPDLFEGHWLPYQIYMSYLRQKSTFHSWQAQRYVAPSVCNNNMESSASWCLLQNKQTEPNGDNRRQVTENHQLVGVSVPKPQAISWYITQIMCCTSFVRVLRLQRRRRRRYVKCSEIEGLLCDTVCRNL